MQRRDFILLSLAGTAGSLLGSPAQAREIVSFVDPRIQPGTIIVRTGERSLYFVTRPGEAIRYRVAVGKAGKQWLGVKYVEEMQVHPCLLYTSDAADE